ncbi:peptide ABC transporter substrate-binding protein [Streptomyces somaliensis]|uniref:ABC transporter substrate-binding protein n=1 Tax=Streptomyces somaliensis (strain ATCC 33201 / DSM 40738 / JCM 12659 / KCTC 9044 / NCTC 11332 / NRRL B-12077 / IP 733) TaxID=1134445 RepID=A0AA44IDL6_STRE0|nr:ABC transporter substrate-binding protein [Streptomyces somaliensis]NKY14859.1 ABC transporter substrate-binding protein [Streptomyces somaliensis DSM 40738]
MPGTTRAVRTAVAVAVLLAATATACGGGGGGGDGVLSSSWGDPQNPLEPANTNEVQGGKVLDMVFRGLKRYDPETGEARDMVAERIETADSRNFTITLKDGWTFSNGEKVTARSFVDAWNYGAHIDNKQNNAPFFSDIVGYEDVHPESGAARAKTMRGLVVKDERTFTVALKDEFSTWPETLGYQAFMPLPRAFFTDRAAWLDRPVGNGPYTVDSYARGSGMSLRRWDGYQGPDKARNAGVDLRVYTDNNTAYQDLISGNLDLVDDIPAQQLKNVGNDLGDRYVNRPALILQTLVFPFYRSEWSKPGMEKVRTGISKAIDREQITERIFRKTRTPARDWTSPALGGKGGYSDVCGDACVHDAAEAKRLITEGGGLPGGRITLTSNVDTGSHRQWMDAVCNSVNNVLGRGPVCTVNPVGTFADFRNQITDGRITGPFRSGWQADYPLIQNFLEPLYRTGASSNHGRFSDRRFDALVDRANAESDQAAAVRHFQDAERILAAQMPAIPLWYQNGSAGYSERLSDVRLNQFSVPVYDQIKVG